MIKWALDVKIWSCNWLIVTVFVQQVHVYDPPGKVAVTCKELQYHNNSYKDSSKTRFH